MPPSLSREDVDRVAALAHVALTDEEAEVLTRQLASVLEYAAQILELDTSGVEPTAHVLGQVPIARADDPIPSLSRDEALANAPDPAAKQGFFRVPRVIA